MAKGNLSDAEREQVRLRLERGGERDSISALAAEFDVSRAAIRHYRPKAKDRPVNEPDNTLDDEAIGIGADDEAEALGVDAGQMAALMANPQVQDMLDKLIAQRLTQLGMGAAPAAANDGTAIAAVLERTLGRMLEVTAQQQPGYIKPLPPGVIEHRLAGKVEMEALIKAYREQGTPPLYAVGEGGFFECTNAILLGEGTEFRTYLPPAVDFVPLNEEARKVHAAMTQWIGGAQTDIGERIKQAQIDAKAPPLIGSEPVQLASATKNGLIDVVKAPSPAARSTLKPQRRSMGTVVTEPVDVSLTGRQPLSAAQTLGGAPATGPRFGD